MILDYSSWNMKGGERSTWPPPEKITFKKPGFISFKHDECYVKNKNGLDGIFGWFPSMVVFSYLFPLF